MNATWVTDLLLPAKLSFLAYLLVIYLLSFLAMYRLKGLRDFMLAGRQLNAPMTALGVGASDMSGWLMMALPGLFLVHGWQLTWMLPVSLMVGAYSNWRWIAKRLRIYTEHASDALTIPSYLDNRFPGSDHGIRLVTAVVSVVFFLIYITAGFVAGGLLMESLFPLSYSQALYGAGLIMICYAVLGGFVAINWIDLLQGSFMLLSLLMVPWVAYNELGGWPSIGVQLSMLSTEHFTGWSGCSWLSLLSLWAWALGYFGQPHILVRFMAIRSAHALGLARRLGMSWMVLALGGACLTGLLGAVYFQAEPLAKPDTVFLVLAQQLFNPWLTGLLVAAVLSAIMSSVTAQLLASASALSEDCYHLFRRQASERELLWVSRLAILGLAGLALILAAQPKQRILDLVSLAWAGLGATFGPVILASLYWRSMTRAMAIGGMMAGAVVVMSWYSLGKLIGGVFDLYAMLPAVVANVLVMWLTKQYTKPQTQSVLALFDRVQALSKECP